MHSVLELQDINKTIQAINTELEDINRIVRYIKLQSLKKTELWNKKLLEAIWQNVIDNEYIN